jgi:hypothetical protein
MIPPLSCSAFRKPSDAEEQGSSKVSHATWNCPALREENSFIVAPPLRAGLVGLRPGATIG